MSKDSLPGAVKTIRAIVDLTFQGRVIHGRQRTRVDGEKGAYEIYTTPGETAEVDQAYGKIVVMDGKAELLSGGFCDVIEESDGYNRYEDWRRKADEPEPLYEKCLTLHAMNWCGLVFPVGMKLRLDLRQFGRGIFVYQDEPVGDGHQLKVLKQSPRKARLSAAEQAGKVDAIFQKLFPAQTA